MKLPSFSRLTDAKYKIQTRFYGVSTTIDLLYDCDVHANYSSQDNNNNY